MKIHILGTPRSGTTSLLNGIADSLNYTIKILEPFSQKQTFVKLKGDYKKHLNFLKNVTYNVVEKNLINNPSDLYPNKTISFYKDYLKNFDVNILITRKNIEEASQSLSHATIKHTWLDSYQKDPNIVDPGAHDFLIKSNSLITQLSKDLNIPLFYYEELFTKNINLTLQKLESVGIKLDNIGPFYHYLNPNKKLGK